MADFRFDRMNEVLTQLQLIEDTLGHRTDSRRLLPTLLKQQRSLEAITSEIARIEEELRATVGQPRIILELDDESLEIITRADQIHALVRNKQLPAEHTEWLRLELDSQLRLWRKAVGQSPLPELRRAQLLAGRLVDARMHQLTSSPDAP